MDENRKTVVLNVGGDMAEVPLESSGRVVLNCLYLVAPFSLSSPTRIFSVEKITGDYVWVYDGGHREGRRRRIDREWLAQSAMVAIVKDSSWSATLRFYGSAVKGGYCVSHLDDDYKPLPEDMIGYSEIVGPDSHHRVWEICPESVKEHAALWPIDSDANVVELRHRGGPASERHIRRTVFDLWLICCGFVDGREAVYAGD